MARSKPRGGGKPRPKRVELASARALPSTRQVEAATRRRGWIDVAVGVLAIVVSAVVAMLREPTDKLEVPILVLASAPMVGTLVIAHGASLLDRRADLPARRDARRWIYGCLAVGFAAGAAWCIGNVIPNRLPPALLHLTSLPILTMTLGAGALLGGRYGWWVAVIAGSLILASTILIIVRILISAAFLAGVYGAFGKAAATFALVAAALVVEVAALLPALGVKFLMSRAGRRAYGLS